ncbi:hypothetical protein F5Y10DRAFT_269148 [Nemania abortiva]|nr:hypothetical protein F5Y10DRAFT_269148 [Nemania abortiva]
MVFQLGGLSFADPKAQQDAQTRPLSLYRRAVSTAGHKTKRPKETEPKAQEQRLHRDVTQPENESNNTSETRPMATYSAEIESPFESRFTGVDSADVPPGARNQSRLYIVKEENIAATIPLKGTNANNNAAVDSYPYEPINNVGVDELESIYTSTVS